jgi:hypothetical protein
LGRIWNAIAISAHSEPSGSHLVIAGADQSDIPCLSGELDGRGFKPAPVLPKEPSRRLPDCRLAFDSRSQSPVTAAEHFANPNSIPTVFSTASKTRNATGALVRQRAARCPLVAKVPQTVKFLESITSWSK